MRNSNKVNEKPIILISGTAGVGKTTVARELVKSLEIDHRLGTGFIREILAAVFDKEFVPFLNTYTFRGKRSQEEILSQFLRQARFLKPAVLRCIRRASREGTSLIIEGNHLIPSLYNKEKVTPFVFLKVTDISLLERMARGNTHTKRALDKTDIQNILMIQEYLLRQATEYGIPVIENKEIQKTVEQILSLLDKK